ncbi:MAG: hypothetical protein KatS3mg081_1364 [Gemmatimonadales bacterium]|nr:MAG: hypothetical protein KatS3mg081_1364 [Gemmatimonadales bacterium]
MGHKPLFLQTVRYKARARRLSRRTERAYVGWIKRFIRYYGFRHPRELGEGEVARFLNHLAAERKAVLGELRGVPWLVAMLLYGSGLRLSEALRLRVKDVDLERRELRVRDTKGGRPRVTVLPEAAVEPLKRHLVAVRELHRADLGRGVEVELPGALGERDPNAPGCGFLGIANCRYSDASAFRLDGGIHGEGTVARPQTVGIWPTPSGGFAIDPQNPSWPIKGPASTSIYVNMLLQKVGAGTGWTRGPVSKTCKDVKTGFFGLGHRLYCQHFVQVGSNKGDSGSPVFTMADSDGAVFVMGIGWGLKESTGEYVFAPLGNVARDLGSLQDYWAIYYNPPPPLAVPISGPTLIQDEGWYEWQANPSSANPRYAYQWYVQWLESGNTDELGTNQRQSLYVTASGNFRLDVIVSAGAETATNFLYVQNEVGGGGGPESPRRARIATGR